MRKEERYNLHTFLVYLYACLVVYTYNKIYNTNIVFIENPVLKNRKSECMTFSRTLAKKGGILGSASDQAACAPSSSIG